MVALGASLEQYFYQLHSDCQPADCTVSPYYGAIKQDCCFDLFSRFVRSTQFILMPRINTNLRGSEKNRGTVLAEECH